MQWSPDDLKAHITFMQDFSDKLGKAGELVGAEGLAPPGEARVVRAGKNGTPAVTDGPFAEAKEFLAGYWIVDVDRPERAYEIAAKASTAPGPGGKPLNMAIEVRQVMSAPPSTFDRDATRPDDRAPASRSRAAGARRRRATPRRFFRRRGCGAGSVDRRGDAVARARNSKESARMAVSRRASPSHRSRAERDRASAPRGGGGERGVGGVGHSYRRRPRRSM